MIHARKDYDRIQDPEGLIGEDEPVFLLRGKDEFAPPAIEAWAANIEPYDRELAEHAYKWADKMREWQKENGTKTPDVPPGEMKEL